MKPCRYSGRWLPGLLAAAVLAVAAAGCLDDEHAIAPVPPDPGGALFTRYVALGNSITAGFQSGGINTVTQRQAYPVLLAEKAGAPFVIPALSPPGCPPPFTGPVPLGADRVATVPCLLREEPPAGRPIQNLAVPGARIADALDNLIPNSAANALTTFILGGRTQVRAMRDARPTLVTAWLGHNDALGAALSGELTDLTPLVDFEASVEALADSITAAGAQEAILIGAMDPVAAVPLLQPGAYFWLLRQAGQLTKPVADDCAPLQADGTPNPLAMGLISFAAVADESIATLRCHPDSGMPHLLTLSEQASLSAGVAAFNTTLEAEAERRDWLFLDPNGLIASFLVDPAALRRCQALPGARSAAGFQQALLESCPHPEAPDFFGWIFTFDGVHPSARAHRIVADALASLLNSRHGLELPIGES